MKPQPKREQATFRSAGPATRREIHNNVIQWRAQAVSDRQRRRTDQLPSPKRGTSSRFENRFLVAIGVIVVLLFVARLAGVL